MNRGKAEPLFDHIRDCLFLRLEHATAQHRRDLDLDLRAAFADEELVDRVFLFQHSGLNASEWNNAFNALCDASQRSLDALERLCSVGNRQIGEVNINRQPGKIPDEQVDCRPALQREALFLRHVG